MGTKTYRATKKATLAYHAFIRLCSDCCGFKPLDIYATAGHERSIDTDPLQTLRVAKPLRSARLAAAVAKGCLQVSSATRIKSGPLTATASGKFLDASQR